MKHSNSAVMIFVVVILWLVGGCGVTQDLTRGTIVMKLERESHISIGSSDGIQVGDILTVYRTKESPLVNQSIVPDRSGKYKPKTKFELVNVGKARVTEILGEHYAAVEPINIQLESSDIFVKGNLEK